MNTTEDLLSLLSIDELSPFFRNSSRVAHVSLCFKGCGGGQCPCDGSSASEDWLASVDDFFAAAAATVNASALSVEFLLDGDGNPGQHTCLVNRWRPVESMFISGNDPADAFTQDDVSKGWDRLVVLNEPAGLLWNLAASLKFGKFASRERPFIVWEPSDAAGMMAAVNTYANAVGAPHAGGFRNAINTDVVTWATHTAPATTRWWRASAPGSKGNISAPRGSPLLSVARRSESPRNLALSVTKSKGGSLTYTSFAFDTGGGAPPPPVLSTGDLPQTATSVATTALALQPLSNQSFFALLSGPSGTSTFVVDPSTGAVSLGSVYPAIAEGVLASAHTVWTDSNVDTVIELAVMESSGDCALAVALGQLGSAPSVNACAVSGTIGKPVSATMSLATFNKGGSVDVQLAGVVTYSINLTLFAFTICATANALTALRVNDPDCFGPLPAVPGARFRPMSAWPFQPGATAPLALYVGAAAGISIFPVPSGGPEGGDDVNVLILASSSFCPNNEADNKRQDVGLCDVPPPRAASPYITYISATGGALTATLLGADLGWRDATTGGAGACSSLVATGMLTTGAPSAPAPAFFMGPNGIEVMALVEGAAAAPGGKVSDPRSCGATEPSEGDVNLLSWPLTIFL
jgi:hypothetical protein